VTLSSLECHVLFEWSLTPFKSDYEQDEEDEWLISPTFYERICAIILAPTKVTNLKCKYSQTCVHRPPLGPRNSGRC
jgi:hypothetical protein